MTMPSPNLAAGALSSTSALDDQPFFTRMAIGLALFILVGFVQWSLRGYVALGTTPWWVHVHGAFMLSWLAIFATQNILAERGAFHFHRQLGWAAMGVVAGIVVFGIAAGLQALALHRTPPFFTNAYFLALTNLGIVIFAGTVAWAVSQRHNTQWHRRLMLGATILLMEPALGRLLPMPLLGDAGEWLVLAIQLATLAILARHDRSVSSAVHPATLSAAAIVIFSHVAVTALALLPAFEDLANHIAGV